MKLQFGWRVKLEIATNVPKNPTRWPGFAIHEQNQNEFVIHESH